MLQIENGLLNELRDVHDLGQDFSIRSSFLKPLQVLIDGFNRLLISRIDVKHLQFFVKDGFLFIVTIGKVNFELITPLLELFNDLSKSILNVGKLLLFHSKHLISLMTHKADIIVVYRPRGVHKLSQIADVFSHIDCNFIKFCELVTIARFKHAPGTD